MGTDCSSDFFSQAIYSRDVFCSAEKGVVPVVI
jgi:hypothetical protein